MNIWREEVWTSPFTIYWDQQFDANIHMMTTEASLESKLCASNIFASAKDSHRCTTTGQTNLYHLHFNHIKCLKADRHIQNSLHPRSDTKSLRASTRMWNAGVECISHHFGSFHYITEHNYIVVKKICFSAQLKLSQLWQWTEQEVRLWMTKLFLKKSQILLNINWSQKQMSLHNI